MCVASALLAFHIAGEVILEGEGGGIDRGILLALRQPGNLSKPIGPAWLLQSAIDISALGGPTFLWLFTAAVAGFLVQIRRWAALGVFVAAVAGASILDAVFKFSFHRARPEVVPHLAEVANASFPSGHAMDSAAFWLTVGALLAHTQKSRGVRAYILTLCVLLTVAIGLSRLLLGVHWPSDVLAGWLFGAAWAMAFWILARKAEAATPGAQEPASRRPR
jgi:undecaprenyl-diphosphatase